MNRGTLYSRIQGFLQSKGEYIIFIDSDDIVLKEGLYNVYNYIKKNQISIVQFNTIFQTNNSLIISTRYYKYNIIIKQPILSYIFFFNEKTKKGDELNTALWDKLIQRETINKIVNFIGYYYFNEKIEIENDVIILFSLFRNADTYQYINETGYYYISTHNNSISNSWKLRDNRSSIVHGIFLNINFLYKRSGNSFLDKLFCIFKLQQSFLRYLICFVNAKSEYPLMEKVFRLLLSSKYIEYEDKYIISNIYYAISLFYNKKYLI